MKIWLWLWTGWLWAQAPLQAMPPWSDHMVLQQQTKVVLRGWAPAQQQVQLQCSWDPHRYQVTSQADGHWDITLQTPKASFTPQSIQVRCGDQTLTLQDVLIGEVWLSSGQSNMEWTLQRCTNAAAEVAAAQHPFIRLFQVKRGQSAQPQSEVPKGSQWAACTPESAAGFSAMSYYFAVELQERLHCPIGILNANWGGTGAESWTPEAPMRRNKALQGVYDRWTQWAQQRQADSLAYLEVKKNQPKAEMPKSLYMLQRPHRRPSVLYNAMIHPLVPYTIKGVIWYQGTSNRSWAYEYTDQMQALIEGWRAAWGYEVPFYYLQLSAFGYADSHLANVIRESQVETLQLPHTAMATVLDLGDLTDIHTPHKKPYGHRLAQMALSNSYGDTQEYCGPLFKKAVFKRNEAILSFTHADSLHLAEPPKSLYVAGADRQFHLAQAYVQKGRLHVYSPEVAQPVAVRYNWNNCPQTALSNAAHLPASPFRTDRWNEVEVPVWPLPKTETSDGQAPQ